MYSKIFMLLMLLLVVSYMDFQQTLINDLNQKEEQK